ncbi:MAG: DUF126 domain-containing protein [Candidatus Hydrogenedentes bacterium]|nr:DUF126 domain-containing protein [Candidatus Hydrogenedentota bacterium]
MPNTSTTKTFRGRGVVGGQAQGPALFTDKAVNFTAAFTKPENLIPFKKAEVRDRHHPWFKMNIRGKVLFIPAAIGSTHTGLVLLDLVRLQKGPAAIIVAHPDPLLVSGIILSQVWYGRSIPVVEYPTDELEGIVQDGQDIQVNGDTGEIVIGGR